MVVRSLVFGFAALLSFTLNQPVQSAETIVRFVPTQASAGFKELKIEEERDDGVSHALSRDQVGAFAMIVPHDFGEYYKRILVRISVDKGADFDWPKKYNDIEFRLGVLIRRDDPFTIEVPIDIPTDISGRHLETLERIPSLNQALDRYVQAAIIFNYFRSAIGPTDPYTRRVARIWYNAAYKLAAEGNRRFFIPDEIGIALEESFASDTEVIGSYRLKIDAVASLVMEDLKRFDRNFRREQCADAAAMLDALQELAQGRPDYLVLRGVVATDITGRLEQISGACALPATSSADNAG
jgi:hypothetical protein